MKLGFNPTQHQGWDPTLPQGPNPSINPLIPFLLTSILLSNHIEPFTYDEKLNFHAPWESCVSSFVTNMISARDRFMQVKFLHRAYYTPKRLTLMNPNTPVACPRCGQSSATFFHMIWSCPRLRDYWLEIADTLSRVTSLELVTDPKLMLLNVFDSRVRGKYTRLFLNYATFYARREIFLHWKDNAPPTVSLWRLKLNSVLPLYKLTYTNRNCPAKFDKIWSGWIDVWGTLGGG